MTWPPKTKDPFLFVYLHSNNETMKSSVTEWFLSSVHETMQQCKVVVSGCSLVMIMCEFEKFVNEVVIFTELFLIRGKFAKFYIDF